MALPKNALSTGIRSIIFERTMSICRQGKNNSAWTISGCPASSQYHGINYMIHLVPNTGGLALCGLSPPPGISPRAPHTVSTAAASDLAEDIPNEFDNSSGVGGREGHVPNESGDHSRNDRLFPNINDPSWIPPNDYGTYVYVPSSPKSHYSALSGDSSDLSDAASLHFHEQNAMAEEEDEEGTATRLDGVTAALGQLSSESRIYTPGDGRGGSGSDYSSTRITRRRFSFETQSSSGSRSKRTNSILDGSVDSLAFSSLPRNRRTGSAADEARDDAMGEDDPLINPRPALEPPTDNTQVGVPPLGHAHNQVANVQPTAPFAGMRRRDLLRHALRRDQMREHVLRALRGMLVIGSEEKKHLRTKK